MPGNCAARRQLRDRCVVLGVYQESRAQPFVRIGLDGVQREVFFCVVRDPLDRAVSAFELPGIAVGGVSVGEPVEEMHRIVRDVTPLLPVDRPRYLMGVGKPDDLVGAVERGVDMFDCVLPTRSGRNGQAFTWNGALNLRNARFAEDTGPLDDRCACPTCATYSRAYLHHLIKSGEMLGAMLLTEHNIGFYQQLMAAMREAIGQDRFAAFAQAFRSAYLGK